MGRASDLNERILISMVRDGYWRVDVEGRVWIVRVKSGPTKGLPRRAEHCTPQGYLQVRALIDGKRLHCGAHRLVWQHAHGDIPAGREINHANGIKDDNRPGNLLCCTAGENVSHAHRGGLLDQHGQRNPAAKLRDADVARIRLAYAQGGHTMQALGDRFGVAVQTISNIVRGKRRPKQGGPTMVDDQRHAGEQDPNTGRFVGKAAAGRLLDGRTWDEVPQ